MVTKWFIKSDNPMQIERKFKEHSEVSTRRVAREGYGTELLVTDENYNVEKYVMIANVINKALLPPEYSVELEIERERTKQAEALIKQKEEETKQLQLRIELKKLETLIHNHSNKLDTHVKIELPDIQPNENIEETDEEIEINAAFWEWLDETIEYTPEKSVIKLIDLVILYTGDDTFSKYNSQILADYKIQLQEYIRVKYPEIRCYQHCIRYENKTHKG